MLSVFVGYWTEMLSVFMGYWTEMLSVFMGYWTEMLFLWGIGQKCCLVSVVLR